MNNLFHTNPLIPTSLKWSRDKMLLCDWIPSKGVTLTTPTYTTLKTTKYLLTPRKLKNSLMNQPCARQIAEFNEFALTVINALELHLANTVNEALDVYVTLIKEVEKLP